jgi:hypothetical protein
MAALVTTSDVKLYLDQVAGTSAYDTLLADLCTKVQDMVELYLGFTFADYTSATTFIAYGKGTPWLSLPPHQIGTVTSVLPEVPVGASAQQVPNWVEQPDGDLYLQSWWPEQRGFYPQRYVVTANWGYGAWPPSVKEVGVEVVINLFKEREKGGFTDIIGVEGAGGIAVGYRHAWTNRQKEILDLIRNKYRALTGIA